MIRLVDGPAEGQTLMLRRAPVFLRVTERDGEFDALDLLDDQPRDDERIHAYKMVHDFGHVHINMGRKGSGFYANATYAMVVEQPSDAQMRNSALWRDWCRSHATAPK